MNTEKLNQWIIALRSGEYAQGKGYLCSSGKYCCLGVYCDIHKIPYDGVKSFPEKPVVFGTFDIMLAIMNDGNYNDMPPSIKADIKMDVEEALKISFDYSKQYSFNEIADFLETNKELICKN